MSVVFKNINKVFPGVDGQPGSHAVRDLNLTIEPGKLVTLLGPSGCGKTTTLRMLAGFETPTDGQVLIEGKDITLTPVNKRDIGMVFQSYALFPHMSVRENIAFGLKVLKVPAEAAARRIDEVMSLMHLTPFGDRAPAQLSGGQQQRVALARAVVIEPKVLLFDEPLSNLDAQLRERMRDELRILQTRLGITSLYVTHDQTEAMAISDRVVVMRNGIIEQDDTPANIYARPRSAFVAEFMGKANILKADIVSVDGNKAHARIGGADVIMPLGDMLLTAGTSVDCVIRPEQITITSDGSGTPAEVQRVVFQGGYAEYAVTLGGQACNIVDYRQHIYGVRQPGETIRLSLADTRPWPLAPSNKAD
ncbi:MAG: ABC transporter [Pelagibacterium sp. SCN 63-23]|mgnify:CR=1 FL=1|nr:MAG: ABC transporter [Pelagibacterium sp. SCN 63-23]